MNNYIIIGSKYYKNIQLDNLLDTFNKNIRCNICIPGNNCGTKIDEYFFNNHVYDNITNKITNFVNNYKHIYDKNILEKFIIWINNNKYNITKIYNNNNFNKIFQEINNFLKENKITQLKKPPRVGYISIFNAIKSNKYSNNIFVFGFSLCNYDTKIGYIGPLKTSDSHDSNSEQQVLIQLHNKKFIDASLCCLTDNSIPELDCEIILPTINTIQIILQHFTTCYLININLEDPLFNILFNNLNNESNLIIKLNNEQKKIQIQLN